MLTVSVIIPYFRGADFARQAVESALSQTWPAIEVLVIDDASPDHASVTLNDYASRVRVIRHETTKGTSEARNTGARLATGEALAFLDQDDWWPPHLVSLVAPHVSRGTAVCYDNEIVGEDGEPRGETVFGRARNWHASVITRANMEIYFSGAPMLKGIVHRTDFERVGGFDRRFLAVEDFYFFVKLLASGVTLRLAENVRGFYREHEKSVTSQIREDGRGILSWLLMCEAIPKELDVPVEVERICRESVSYWRWRRARFLLRTAIKKRSLRPLASRRAVLEIGGGLACSVRMPFIHR